MPALALTSGDPGGIGPEIIVKSLKRLPSRRRAAYIVVGARAAYLLLRKKTGLFFNWDEIRADDVRRLRPGSISFLDVTAAASKIARAPLENVAPEPGKLSRINAAMALAALDQATNLARAGAAQALVTAPLNKTSVRLLLPGFHGHTEYLARKAGVKKFAMMFVSPRLKVTLITIHVALKDVSRAVTRAKVLEKISLTHEFFKKRLGLALPRLGLCALNPHGRETGTEEDRVLAPAVAAARRRGIRIEGPISADRIFYDAYHGRYDGLISMYHDQALAPFKMIAFHDGVNTTLGLPFVRTSPDHGTAFDIAYQGRADASSMQASLALAAKLIA